MKRKRECVKFLAFFRYRLKKSLLPEKYYLIGFLLVVFIAASLTLVFLRLISGNMSIDPPYSEWWRFPVIPVMLVFYFHGVYVKQKGEKVVSFVCILIYAIYISEQFIKNKDIYFFLKAIQYILAIACCLIFIFMIVRKRISKAERSNTK